MVHPGVQRLSWPASASKAWPSWLRCAIYGAEGLSHARLSRSGEGGIAGEHRGVPTGAGVAAFLPHMCEAQQEREKKKKNREMARGTWPVALYSSTERLGVRQSEIGGNNRSNLIIFGLNTVSTRRVFDRMTEPNQILNFGDFSSWLG